jgi:hypothetical protein
VDAQGRSLERRNGAKEYGVSREFILRGIQSGQLETREGSGWGNPYFKVLRSQIEAYIASELGSEYLSGKKCHTKSG